MEKYSFDEAQDEAQEIQENIKQKNESDDMDDSDHDPIERCPSDELKEFTFPKIYRLPNYDEENRFARVFDSTKLIEELRRQRNILNTGDNYDTPLKTGLAKILGIYNNIIAGHDYLETQDNVCLDICSSDNDKLAQDIFDFFSEKLTFIIERNSSGDIIDNQNNITEETRRLLLENLSKIKGVDKIDPKIESKSGCMDVLFSVYPGIESQIRFNSSQYNPNPRAQDYPFLNSKNKPFAKRLSFCHYLSSKGYKNMHCDLLTQLELLEFLKQKGHVGALQLRQNPAQYNNGLLEYYAI